MHPAAGAIATLGCALAGGALGVAFGAGAISKISVNPKTGAVELSFVTTGPAKPA
jgi:hypothetical protein